MKIARFYLLAALIVVLSACTDKDLPGVSGSGKLGKGFFVLNQGNYTLANSSLSFFNSDSAKMTNNVFYRANNVPLGDVAQSMTLWKNHGFIVVNNSGLIYVVRADDATFAGKIAGLQSPRYICFIDQEKAYVSDIQLPEIHIINPLSLEKTGTLATLKSVENMIFTKNKVFAANWSDYYTSGKNNTLMVIDPQLDEVVDSIVLAKEPNSMVVDHEGYLWVLCSGGFMNDEYGALFRINTDSHEIDRRLDFSEIADSPFGLTIDGGGTTLYYVNKNIYKLSVNDLALPDQALVEAGQRNFFSIGIDPAASILVATDARNYTTDGQVFRFTSNGTLIDSVKAGIIPGQIVFN
jgi:DNA-binding beta-propeller fold protein YncE